MRASARDVARFGHHFVSGSIVSMATVREALTAVTLADGSSAGTDRFQVDSGGASGETGTVAPWPITRGTLQAPEVCSWCTRATASPSPCCRTPPGPHEWRRRRSCSPPRSWAPSMRTTSIVRTASTTSRGGSTATSRVARSNWWLTVPLCTATIHSKGELAKRFSAETFPAVQVSRDADEQVFAVAYPWGLAAIRFARAGDSLSVAGDFAGREISARGLLRAD